MAIRAPLTPGVVRDLLNRVTMTHQERAMMSLRALVLEVEKEAKLNASEGAHKRGTPSPAVPGHGPAVISGDLRRSITHTRVTKTRMWSKVGPAETPHSTYGYNTSGITSGKLGRILELDGIRANGAIYPFLVPALETVAPSTYKLFREGFSGWDGTT